MKANMTLFRKSNEFAIDLIAGSKLDKRILAELYEMLREEFKKNKRRITLNVGTLSASILNEQCHRVSLGLKLKGLTKGE